MRCNKQPAPIFGGTPVDEQLKQAGNRLDAAYADIKKLSDHADPETGIVPQHLVIEAQTGLQAAKQEFDLYQEIRRMINNIYDTIIRNINPR